MSQTSRQLSPTQPPAAPVNGFWVWDVQADRMFGHASMADYFGTSVNDVVAGLPAASFVACIHAEDRLAIDAAVRHTLMTGSPYHVCYRVHSPRLGLRRMAAEGHCHFDVAGKPTVFSGWFIDITNSAVAARASLGLCQHFLDQARHAADAGGHQLVSYLLGVVRQETESGQQGDGATR